MQGNRAARMPVLDRHWQAVEILPRDGMTFQNFYLHIQVREASQTVLRVLFIHWNRHRLAPMYYYLPNMTHTWTDSPAVGRGVYDKRNILYVWRVAWAVRLAHRTTFVGSLVCYLTNILPNPAILALIARRDTIKTFVKSRRGELHFCGRFILI